MIVVVGEQISEEDDIIAIASWPMLNELIIYGNPIVYRNVGYPPLLQQYLIDRLGINIKRYFIYTYLYKYVDSIT